jgi:hypothetical protein
MLQGHGAISGMAHLEKTLDNAEGESGGQQERVLKRIFNDVLLAFMFFPFFHHLWFLWFLCWLVDDLALIVVVSRIFPRVPGPSALIATPLCLLWLVPLTMFTQSFMHWGGTMPGFGPDTSAGLIPMPHVLIHYSIFFGFGLLMYDSHGATEHLSRGWWIQLPLGLLLIPVVLALALHLPWSHNLVGDEDTRRLLANLGQVLCTWLMIFSASWGCSR